MNPQSRDSYQPSERGVHSNRCMRGGEGSIIAGSLGDGAVEMRVSMVWSEREGSQESIWFYHQRGLDG